MLEHCRILELGDGRSAFGGQMLAMLGAEVILVEPPGGSGTRHRAPFVDDRPGVESSLVHVGFNRGKKSMVLDLTAPQDRASFAELVRDSDVVIDSGGPEERAALGHPDSAELWAMNPGLVHGVVSPFGSTGPKADWKGTDLVVAAAGAQMSITGNPGVAPLRTAVPQTWLHASTDLAIGVLLALRTAGSSGSGQFVDISAQHSWVEAAFHYPLFSSWGEPDPVRNGSHVRIGAVGSTFDFPASDGHITLTLLFGAAVGPFTNRFVQWMAEEGACDPSWGEIDFVAYDPSTQLEHFEDLKQAIAAFTSTKTKEELDRAAWDRRLLIAPVATLQEVLDQPHFEARGVFRSVEFPEAVGGGSPRVPGPMAKTSPTPLTELAAAPLLGAHDHSVQVRRTEPAKTAGRQGIARRPLEGVKVLDLTISFAGPIIGRALAAHGATVVKVESEERPDLTRTAGVFMNGDTVDHSGCFAHFNANKWSLGMNITRPGGGEVMRDLAAWADIVICSFAPGALDRMGLDPATRRALNPGLITLTSTLLGLDGPLSGLAGYGNMAAATCGFFSTTGWPDRAPVGPMGAYTDIISPRMAAALLIAALEHRDRTGEALDIDFGQGESCLHLLTLGMLDSQVNGRSWERIGNIDHFHAPHGVYRAAGDDEWVAMAVHSDDEWDLVAGLIDAAGWVGQELQERLDRRSEIDECIERWTRTRQAEDVASALQDMGIAAHAVQNGSHCERDAQLAHRNWTTVLPHERIGKLTVGTTPVLLGGTPARFDEAGPTLGEHTFQVLTDLLGYDADRIAELAVAGALE